MKIPSPRVLVYGAMLLAIGLFSWWKFAGDPRSAFESKVQDLIEQANRGEHPALRKKLSPEAENLISSNYMTVPQALLLARKMDLDHHTRYRLVHIDMFYPKDYAEVLLERSGPEGDFSAARSFPVPFVYRKGEWLVAGGFRGERDFNNPFE